MRFSVAAACSRHLYSWLHGFPDVGPVKGLIDFWAPVQLNRDEPTFTEELICNEGRTQTSRPCGGANYSLYYSKSQQHDLGSVV